MPFVLGFSSPEHDMLKVYYSDQSLSVERQSVNLLTKHLLCNYCVISMNFTGSFIW